MTPSRVRPRSDVGLPDRVRARLLGSAAPPDAHRLAAAVREESRGLADASLLLDTVHEVEAELLGTGPLTPLLADPTVTDILVNAPDEVWVDRGDGLRRAEVGFADEPAVRRLAVRLANAAGRRLDTAQPFVDARLPGGLRLHAVLPPVATRGTCLSLRVLRPRHFDLDVLVRSGSVGPTAAALLRAVVSARLAVCVSGGTGSGKTTLLGVLLGLVPPGERVVLVEDAAEVTAAHAHVVRLECRPANVEGAGAVGLRDLVRQALRMRPDRLVVGEVRGAEVVDLLVALNTGHDGGLTTVHANAATDVPARLEALGALAGLARTTLHSLLAAAVQVVVHLRRDRGRRRLAEVAVLRPEPSGLVVAEEAVRVCDADFRTPDARTPDNLRLGSGAGRLAALLQARGVAPPPVLGS